MLLLGIETSCDETAAAVVKDGRQVLSSIVASQDKLHLPYGGVVPEIACRAHHARVVVRIHVNRSAGECKAAGARSVGHVPGLSEQDGREAEGGG